MAKWKEKYRESVANMSNRELYEEFKQTIIDYYDDCSTSGDRFRYEECKTEFEYRLKTNGFLD